MECNAVNIKILLLLFAKRRSLNTLALPRIFTDCFEYPIPYLTQSTQKVLAKFSCPKKSQRQNFQSQKIHSISPITWIPEYPSLHLLLRYSIHWTLIRGTSGGGPPLYLDQTEAQRAGKRFFWDRPSSFILGCGSATSNDHFLWREYLTQVWHKLGDVTTWIKPYRIGWKNKQKQKIMVHSPITKSCEELGPRKYVLKGCNTTVGQGTMPLRVWNLVCSQTFLFLFRGVSAYKPTKLWGTCWPFESLTLYRGTSI